MSLLLTGCCYVLELNLEIIPSDQPRSRDLIFDPSGPVLEKNPTPIEKRDLAALAATAVSGMQPSGRALPTLVVGAPSTSAEHISAACAASPLDSLINIAFPMRVKSLLSSHLSDPSGTVNRRARALGTFRDIDMKLPPYRKTWTDRPGPSSPARNINQPLLHLLVKRFDFPDKEIVNSVADGMPIAGDIPSIPGLKPRAKPDVLSMAEWAAGIADRNVNAIGRAKRFRGTDLGGD